jgi:hypothetical protein
MDYKYWINGFPATFATNREKIWKQQLCQALSGKQYYENSIDLQFVFTKSNYENHEFDIDNLCEPVFAVLASSLRWFSGKRRNITLWTARKCIGKEQGLFIRSINSNTLLTSNSIPLFDEVYDGVLPTKATDKNIPSWIKEFGQFKVVEKCSVRLEFQNTPVSIATISSGKVKPIIDCLYPIIGGTPGAPNDEIIEMLTVERVNNTTQRSAIRITIWEEHDQLISMVDDISSI